MGKPSTLATAVVASLNAATLTAATTFTRKLLPIIKLTDISNPAGFVYIGGVAYEKLNRCADYAESIDLGLYVTAQVTNTNGLPDDSDIAAKQDLIESIVDHLKTVGKIDGYHLTEIEIPAPFDHDRVFQESVFDCTLTLRYKGF